MSDENENEVQLPVLTKEQAKALYAQLAEKLEKINEAAAEAAEFADEHGLYFRIDLGEYYPKGDFVVEEYGDDSEIVRENEGDEYGGKGWVSSYC